MDWTVILAAGAFALSLATAIGGLVFLIIKLTVDPMKEAIRQIQETLHPMELKLKTESELKRMTDLAIAEHKEKCREDTERRLRQSGSVKPVHVGIAILIALLLALAGAGCAGHRISQDFTDGTSYGFLRSHRAERGPSETVVVEEFDAAGKLVSRTTTTRHPAMAVECSSNAGDVLMGFNQVLGTLIEGGEKLK